MILESSVEQKKNYLNNRIISVPLSILGWDQESSKRKGTGVENV